MNKPKLSIVYYLNSLPLAWGFIHGEQHELCALDFSPPSRCADLLSEGRVDAGLIPAIEYQRIPELRIVPDLAVASKLSVKSVLLISKVPARKIRTLAADNSSRTSVGLLRILLQSKFQVDPHIQSQRPDLKEMLQKHDAALMIGDAALKAKADGLFTYDLAEEWRSQTGKPFVFAFWAVRKSSLMRDCSAFQESFQYGRAHLESIAREQSQRLDLSEYQILRYLTENIDYSLDQENLDGLCLFYRLAREYCLLDSLRELEFI
jgi:chorismate dehydratase